MKSSRREKKSQVVISVLGSGLAVPMMRERKREGEIERTNFQTKFSGKNFWEPISLPEFRDCQKIIIGLVSQNRNGKIKMFNQNLS
jgi:hypothetical protein